MTSSTSITPTCKSASAVRRSRWRLFFTFLELCVLSKLVKVQLRSQVDDTITYLNLLVSLEVFHILSISACFALILAVHGWSSFCLTSIWSWKLCVLSTQRFHMRHVCSQQSRRKSAVTNAFEYLLCNQISFICINFGFLLLHLFRVIFDVVDSLCLSICVLQKQKCQVCYNRHERISLTDICMRFLQLLRLGGSVFLAFL